jgi:uridine kinase
MSLLKQVRGLMKRETTGQGDNVKPLADLQPNDATVEVMLRIADDIMGQLRAAREAGSGEALVVGIVGSVGAGKSTFAQVLKLLLRSECCTGVGVRPGRKGTSLDGPPPPRVEEVSLDDFLSSQEERFELGINNRWELNATAEYFAESVLAKLKTLGADGAVDVPCFSKGLDDRLDTVRTVRGPVDVVLFEGWRIGVDHPNFYPFNRLVDTLVFLEVDFNAIIDSTVTLYPNPRNSLPPPSIRSLVLLSVSLSVSVCASLRFARNSGLGTRGSLWSRQK